MFNKAITWLDGLSPFVQGILGSAIFAFIVWVGRRVISIVISLNRELKKANDIDVVTKYWIHKNYVHASGLYFFTQGYLYILTKAFQWFLKAMLAVSFYFGVMAILEQKFLQLFVALIVFFWIYEGHSWLIDYSSNERIKKVDPKIKEQVLSKLGNPKDNIEQMMFGAQRGDKEEKTEER